LAKFSEQAEEEKETYLVSAFHVMLSDEAKSPRLVNKNRRITAVAQLSAERSAKESPHPCCLLGLDGEEPYFAGFGQPRSE
jgi:hypothetical protein